MRREADGLDSPAGRLLVKTVEAMPDLTDKNRRPAAPRL